ncbi:MAG: RNA polymerase sigma factor [Clostridia bacterium]|nr:RNA polymerase sigma factor [Clostridia bacterium]
MDIKQIVDKYGDMLFRVCLAQLRSRFDAEDAVQDVFVKLIRDGSGEELDSEHLKARLIRTAVNRCHDLRRREKYRATEELYDECAAEELSSEQTELFDALYNLPERFRVAVSLYYIEGYSVKEIAGIVKSTESAVKMRLKKGRELLRVLLEEEK